MLDASGHDDYSGEIPVVGRLRMLWSHFSAWNSLNWAVNPQCQPRPPDIVGQAITYFNQGLYALCSPAGSRFFFTKLASGRNTSAQSWQHRDVNMQIMAFTIDLGLDLIMLASISKNE